MPCRAAGGADPGVMEVAPPVVPDSDDQPAPPLPGDSGAALSAQLTANPRRGRLKIFLAPASGAGATSAMLIDGLALRAQGTVVLAGAVETHGWPGTQQLAAQLETLPPRLVEHRGGHLAAFDLDAALVRRPRLVLLDDLAATNPQGCRHAQRWQDARELLDAGIDVHATLEVSRLESLAHVVERVSGHEARERERVPDDVLDLAHDLQVVDVPAEELLRRMRAAPAPREVTLGLQQISALRDLALRVGADRLRVRGEREGARAGTGERLLVCIDASALSARVVRAARRMAGLLDAEWTALYVETMEQRRLPEAKRLGTIENLRLAELLGAEVITLTGDDVAEETLAFARRRGVTRIIVGKAMAPRWRDLLAQPLAWRLVRGRGSIDVYVVNGDAATPAERMADARAESTPLAWGGYAAATGVVAAATLICYPLQNLISQVNVSMVYLLGVVVVAARGLIGPAILATVLGMLAFDFVFVLPFFAFSFRQTEYIIAFGAILIVGMLVSTLTVRLRHQVESAFQREAQTAALHACSRDLAIAPELTQIIGAAVRHAELMFGCPPALLLPDGEGKVTCRGGDATRCRLGTPTMIAAQWAFTNARPAGPGTGTLRRIDALLTPLVASRGTVGLLALFHTGARQFENPERRNAVEAFAHLVALAIERDILASEAQVARVDAESERLRNALLSSVSHDLRTPLAAITGAASSLYEHDALLDPESRRELARTIAEEGDQLNRLVHNLLDMTRLEGGKVRLRREPHPPEDLIGSTLITMERRLRERTVELRIAPDLPAIPLDGILIQEVLINLIENAIKYTPAGTPIILGASAGEGLARITVEDRGPGIEPGERERVFEKFYRGSTQGHTPGVGLGLAICRGIVEAHGGRVHIESADPCGARFVITLPLDPAPPATGMATAP